ncbi:hypothetical protein BDV40DRAFT_304608 [Aspergillus tamarii]|uniref:NAD(P)-binding domain-containing protein n=1 Tax=Aspergillus tamarii TaxID=41984 RepID=A0A5N6UHL5_ASPTM|nr:hypothetical protein BDV40DRAFT_304608 [Aspergillus tamarii]
MSKMSRIINTEELVRNAPFELSKADKEVLTTTEEVFYPAYLGGYSKYNWLEDFLTCDGMIRSDHTQLNSLPVLKSILVTGGAGFIGDWFVRHLLQTYSDRYSVTCFDSLDYCAPIYNFKAVAQASNFQFVKGAVCAPKAVENVFHNYRIDSIVHFAARSHIDTSLNDPLSFTHTNVMGT